MKLFCLPLFSFLLSCSVAAQENISLATSPTIDTSLHIEPQASLLKNTFHFDGDIAGFPFYGGGLYPIATSISYELLVTTHDKSSTFARIGLGGLRGFEDVGLLGFFQFGILTGPKNHHLEISAGFSYFSYDSLIFLGSIGWRFQKPGGNFNFRMGINNKVYWLTTYFGIGYSF